MNQTQVRFRGEKKNNRTEYTITHGLLSPYMYISFCLQYNLFIVKIFTRQINRSFARQSLRSSIEISALFIGSILPLSVCVCIYIRVILHSVTKSIEESISPNIASRCIGCENDWWMVKWRIGSIKSEVIFVVVCHLVFAYGGRGV